MPKKRVTIDLSENAAKEVDRLTIANEMTIADLFRFSLTMFRIYFDETRKGREIWIHDPATGDNHRIVLPL